MHRFDRCQVTRLLLVWDKEIIRREAQAAGKKAGAAFMHKGGFFRTLQRFGFFTLDLVKAEANGMLVPL